MFIRIKKIKGHRYAYLVANSWTSGGARQKVAKYLGKIIESQNCSEKSFDEFLSTDSAKLIMESPYIESIKKLVEWELSRHQISLKIDYETGQVQNSSGKEVVISMHDGFFGTHTLKSLLNYNSAEDPGDFLAEIITGAGIAIEKDTFVMLFEKMKQNLQHESAKKMDFYY